MAVFAKYHSPLGDMTIRSEGDAISGIWFDGQKYFPDMQTARFTSTPDFVTLQCIEWLARYFCGEKPEMSIPLLLSGTPFREAVWKQLLLIPYGTTTTYGAIRKQLPEPFNKVSAQAVGGAIGHNPVSILVPCHRVVAANGELRGYAGGLEKKQALLLLEGK